MNFNVRKLFLFLGMAGVIGLGLLTSFVVSAGTPPPPPGIAPPVITGIGPELLEDQTIYVYGENFQPGATVMLKRALFDEGGCSGNVLEFEPTELTVDFSRCGDSWPAGITRYVLTVTNPDGQYDEFEFIIDCTCDGYCRVGGE